MKVLLGISGASGAVYGVRTGTVLLAAGAELHVLVTKTAWEILAEEIPGGPPPASQQARRLWIARLLSAPPGKCRLHPEDDFRIPFASGSNPPDAVVIAPCSMGMLGRIAHGVSTSVLERCADVALKEKRPLVLVPRETPLSAIHLENMLALSRAGAEILPACPGFYHRPSSVEDLVDFVVSRVVSRLGVDIARVPRWGEAAEKETKGREKAGSAGSLRRLRRRR
ncbi:MAG: UbiX family flavin prenyltransferase [Deltaproteobacteria bacterium]|nr:UbiX family flavin prenyltransferase [Deltaproteobacteria bacterium]PWB60453.1 MAG: aromatic acid decarboxylase [Deltaproteobacteria bacterium]